MGKTTGFLEYARRDNALLPEKERIRTFDEFKRPLLMEARTEQAGRCMNCGVPFCQSAMVLHGMVTGCPLHNLIPEFNDLLWLGHPDQAYLRLRMTSPFPEFTGRVCPALCEKACTCGEHSDPVSVHDNELSLIEYAFEKDLVKPRIPKNRSGKRVAVIGSGPSGLACADALNRRGHSVTVFERDDRVGGLLVYGIPNMKLDKRVIERRAALMEEEGVVFRTGVRIETKEQASSLLHDYDAVALCCGSRKARGLSCASPEIPGVFYAVDFLTSTTRAVLAASDHSALALQKRGGFFNARNKHVVVVGGGDTGNDCIGTVIRHGCRSVTALEMMPKPPIDRAADNPWPEWPRTLRTDYGHQEAMAVWGRDPRVYETTVKEVLLTEEGVLREIVTSKVAFSGRQMTLLEGSEKKLRCDLLIIAAGFTGCEPELPALFGAPLTERGLMATKTGHFTGIDGLYTAGDMRRGPSLVVWAIAEGKECAGEIDAALSGF